MKLLTYRRTRAVFLAVALFTLLQLQGVLVEIASPHIGDFLSLRLGITTPLLIYALILTVALGIIFTITQELRSGSKEHDSTTTEDEIEGYTKRLQESLAALYQRRYEQKLDSRLEIALEVRPDWNRRKIELVNETFEHTGGVGNGTRVVSKVFAEKGRLLIIGKPGAGKTVLLLKLAVSLLREQGNSAKEPFPIIFNLASWSEQYSRFEDWLAAALQSGYGLSTEFAGALLNERRVIFFLDGLDELGANEDEQRAMQTRAACLNSLNRALNRGVRSVICCRSNEFKQLRQFSGQDAPVSAIVTIQDLSPSQIKSALLSAAESTDTDRHSDSTAARHLIELLKQKRGRTLLDLLRTPYYFTIALEVFDSPIVDKLVLPTSQDELKDQLLARFIERKLEDTPNPHRYKREQVLRWLNWLAVVLFVSGRTTFELSDIQTQHIQIKSNYLVTYGICMGLVMEAAFMIAFGPKLWGLGFFFGAFSFSLTSGLDFKRRIVTEDIRHWKFSKLFQWQNWGIWLVFIVAISVGAGYLFRWVAIKMGGNQIPVNKVFWYGVVMVASILIFQNTVRSTRVISFYSHLKSPYQRLRSGIVVRLVERLFVGLLFSLSYLYIFRAHFSIVIFGTLLFALSSFFSSPMGRHLMVRLCLRFEKRMPLRYATFLDYASDAGLLEKNGGQWRFRHQNLLYYFGSLPGRH